MRGTVPSRACFCSLLVAIVLLNNSDGQHRRGYPTPPEPGVQGGPAAPEPQRSIRRLDTPAMEREARELSALASSIPGDIELLKKGLLPSDAIEKLKRIEKLSKRLRQQIRP
jgi:hypothetical protein